ncbi:MAG TPA: hypothetical protein VL461_11895 [Dictyobacter sp.]|jgi:hypothetical protein|nr:hypothetical protein [Dictyobacter sp.]
MAGWEEELSTLLNELGVRQEEPQTSIQQGHKPTWHEGQRRERLTDILLRGSDQEGDEDEAWIGDLDVMRHEVDSIVSQVVLLMQRGDLEPALKEDVMVVLRALHRQIPSARLSTSNDEAYLESAAAMLHFCRLVLQLSELATGDF